MKTGKLDKEVISGVRGHGYPAGPGDRDDLAVNLVSGSFEIVMANRAQESLIGKPTKVLLGQKCYTAFENRTAVCPDCPGVIALADGTPAQAIQISAPADGGPYRLLVSAYPVFGIAGEPIGFVEVVERIRESEPLARLMAVFTRAESLYRTASTPSWLLRFGLDTALELEGVDMGCAFTVEGGEARILCSRGFPVDLARSLMNLELSRRRVSCLPRPCGPLSDSPARIPISNCVVVPVLPTGKVAGGLLLGSENLSELPATTTRALALLASMLTIRFEKMTDPSRGAEIRGVTSRRDETESSQEVGFRRPMVPGPIGRSRLDSARALLRDMLQDGPLTYREIKQRADAQLVSLGTLRRAKISLGVVSCKTGPHGRWYWALPEATSSASIR